jgi:hypothetical protein
MQDTLLSMAHLLVGVRRKGSVNKHRRFMLKKFTIALVVLAALALPALGSSYDRQPVVMSGLTADDWAGTLAWSQESLIGRFVGIKTARCTGIIIRGQGVRGSSFLHGNARYWDKTYCTGTLHGRTATYSLVRDTKGTSYWKIYRLKGVSIESLRTLAPTTSPNPRPKPPQARCDPNYSSGCVPVVPYDLDCADIYGPVYVVGRDIHGFDGDGDGVGCES